MTNLVEDVPLGGRAGRLGRHEVRAPERFAHIDIAEASDVLLIEKRALQRLGLACETLRQIGGAELVAEGWIVPGLVGAHTHPGAEEPGQPLDDGILRDDLRAHLDAGVTLIRAPGLAGDPPDQPFGSSSSRSGSRSGALSR